MLFAQQFAKAYFNIGLIFEQKQEIKTAIINYEKSVKKMIDIKEGGLPAGAIPDSFSQDTFFKASTNLSVCLEKDG